MLLIMMEQIQSEVVSFGNEARKVAKSTSVSFATRYTLERALRQIRAFKEAYNAQCPDQVVDYRLLTVSVIDDLPDDLCRELKLCVVEHLDG